MTENFLHYIWKYRLFDSKTLKLASGEILEVLKPGEHNTDGGPDFQNALIKIGKTTWAGNVEIHLNASDWMKHHHQKDEAYDNIILHVVLENDFTATRINGEKIPIFELKDIIPDSIFIKYNSFINSKNWIPCEGSIKRTDHVTLVSWMDRLLVERLERKLESINDLLKIYKNSWEHAFYIHIARNFGFKLNSEIFETLARATPLTYLNKHKNSIFQLESLLFGQSGLLEKNKRDTYAFSLLQEYEILKQKFSLSPVKGHLWKFLRLNPSGFPTIRIAQFASLIHKSSHLFSKILEATKLTEIEDLFDAECSDYWQTHFIFGKDSPKRSKHVGKAAIDNIIINTVVPFLFIYGVKKNEEKYKDRALRLLEQIEGEKNSLIIKWKFLGMPVKNAYNTQALLELKNNYCNPKQCLNCGIGNYLLRKTK